MKISLLETGSKGYCHDCHNRAAIEVTFAHRQPIHLCERDARYLIKHVTTILGNGNKKNDHTK